MDKENSLQNFALNADPKDLADALRRLSASGQVLDIGQKAKLGIGRLGYEMPINNQESVILGVSGQKAWNNPYIPTQATGFDVGYASPKQDFMIGYSATPSQLDGQPLGKHGVFAKYNRRF